MNDIDNRQTIFKLSKSAREFLSEKGEGNMTKGLMLLLKQAGYSSKIDLSNSKNPIIRRETNFAKEEYQYLLIKNKKTLSKIAISFEIQREMINKFGKDIFFEEAVIKGLLRMPGFDQQSSQIEDIIDLQSGQVVYQRPNRENRIQIRNYFDNFERLLSLLKESFENELDTEKVETILKNMEKIAKDESRLKDEIKNIKFYKDTITNVFRKDIANVYKQAFYDLLDSEKKSKELIAKK